MEKVLKMLRNLRQNGYLRLVLEKLKLVETYQRVADPSKCGKPYFMRDQPDEVFEDQRIDLTGSDGEEPREVIDVDAFHGELMDFRTKEEREEEEPTQPTQPAVPAPATASNKGGKQRMSVDAGRGRYWD